MKKILLFLFLFTGGISFAQDSNEPASKNEGLNEIKFNAGAVIFEVVELTYERIVADHVGVGMSLAYNAIEFPSFRGYALPYFRFYPSEKRKGSGFFLEANSGVIFSQQQTGFFSPTSGFSSEDEEFASFGFGIAVGGKWVTDSGLFGEVYGGFGREFNEDSFLENYPRFGLNFGYRF